MIILLLNVKDNLWLLLRHEKLLHCLILGSYILIKELITCLGCMVAMMNVLFLLIQIVHFRALVVFSFKFLNLAKLVIIRLWYILLIRADVIKVFLNKLLKVANLIPFMKAWLLVQFMCSTLFWLPHPNYVFYIISLQLFKVWSSIRGTYTTL